MSERTILQSFAANNEGKLVSIRDVQRGKACECACPACGEVLIARQGDVRAWHFAHESGSDCEGGAESALHLAAKQLVAEAHWILVPGLEVQGYYPSEKQPTDSASVSRPAWTLFIDDAKQEVPWQTRIGRITPDVVLVCGDEKVFVEIAVTHTVDDQKKRKLEELGISTMEIDMDLTLREEWTWEELRREVLETLENRHWVFHSDAKSLRREADQLARQKATEREEGGNSKKVQNEARLLLTTVPVKVRQYAWGVILWSGYDVTTNEIFKSTARRFGARWNPRYKSWNYAPGLFDALIEYLESVGAQRD